LELDSPNLQNTENEATLLLPLGTQKLKGFQLRGLCPVTPWSGVLSWAPARAPPRQVCPPHILWPGDAPSDGPQWRVKSELLMLSSPAPKWLSDVYCLYVQSVGAAFCTAAAAAVRSTVAHGTTQLSSAQVAILRREWVAFHALVSVPITTLQLPHTFSRLKNQQEW